MKTLDRFAKLFSGLTRAYGTFKPQKYNSSKSKLEGKYQTVSGLLTDKNYNDHLTGRVSLGIVPITDNAKCSFAAIDIDDYTLDLNLLQKKIVDIPAIACRSKSGGIHLYFFFDKPLAAKAVRTKLREISITLGFSGAEIFPKQVKLSGKDDPAGKGSWINLPYFDYKNTKRYAFDKGGKQLPLSKFLQEVKLLDLKALKAIKPTFKVHFSDGPPCLQVLSTTKCDSARNIFLFNVATYCKRRYPEEWQSKVHRANTSFCLPPIRDKEVNETVASSQGRKTYEYTCDEEPLIGCCNRRDCIKRKYGINKYGEVAFSVSSLVQLTTEPPTWYLTVDDIRMRLDTEDLLNQGRFRKACVEQIGKLPPTVKADKWDSMIRAALESMEVVKAPYDATPAGLLEAHLDMFLSTRSFAQNRAEILLGKPWKEEDVCYFRSHDFMKYLTQQKFPMSAKEVWEVLHKVGSAPRQINVKGRVIRTWGVPYTKTEAIEIEVKGEGNDF